MKLAKKYSKYELYAIVSLLAIMFWAWGYFLNRHLMSGRFGHGSYQILGISGIVVLILMIIKGIPGHRISWLRSFRWVYVASFGLAALAILNTASTSDCPSDAWPECPPRDLADLEALMVDMGKPGVLPPQPYSICYNYDPDIHGQANKVPYATNRTACPDAPTVGQPGRNYYQGKALCKYDHPEGHDWPPSPQCWKFPPIPPAILMPLVGMVGLIPLVGMVTYVRPKLSARALQIVVGLLFLCFLFYIYYWGHSVHPFYLGRPWSEFNYAYDYTVPVVFFPASFIHLFCCSLAYCQLGKSKPMPA